MTKSSPSPARPRGQAKTILDVAQELIQRRGYNGFSYADIAERLKVTKASLHYHFASKAELGRALIERYHATFVAALEAIDHETSDPAGQLQRYVRLYDLVLSDDRMCLCGMLAAEFTTLPKAMQARLRKYFDANERWLAQVLARGRAGDHLRFPESARERAKLLVGALEGAILVARSYQDPRRFRAAAAQLLDDLNDPRR